MASADQRTEQPTQRRMQQARREGQFLTSRELVGAAQFAAFVAVLVGLAPDWFTTLRVHFGTLLERSATISLTPFEIVRMTREAVVLYARQFAWLAAAITLAPLALHLAITQFGFSSKRLQPDFARLNPWSRLKEMPSNNMASLVRAALILPLLLLAVYRVAQGELVRVPSLPRMGLGSSLGLIVDSVKRLLWEATGVIVLIGVLDFVREYRRHTGQLKMSKQEIREEMKESEGNPLIKMQIRRLQRDRARRRMMQQVPTSTAVIVNPTHYAVAIRYEMNAMSVPQVVAKGKNYLARRIKEIAIENNVPIVENPPLARALYQSVPVGQEIPAELYRAVAEILAYIYRLMHPSTASNPRRNS